MPNPDTMATKTLAAIEQMLVKDQGATFRGELGKIMPQMKDAYSTEPGGFRSHLGASTLGNKCARAIWYGFRWATKPVFQGRTLRLFNRGHLEEARFLAMLQAIGCTVAQSDENGNQYRISGAGGHYGGSGDGFAQNIPDLEPGMWCLLEFKTHNDASFKKLVAEGLRASKFEHYVQMQQYMRKMGLAAGLYMAVNKNNDEVYACIITLDTETADQFIARAEKIVWMLQAPDKIGNPPSVGNFDCKWCDHRPVCHLKGAPSVNCRTCTHVTPAANAEWICRNPAHLTGLQEGIVIPKELQKTGCGNWSKHKDMG